MTSRRSAIGLLAAGALLAASPLGAAFTVVPASAESWDELVTAAMKEGQVTVHSAPGRAYEEALAEGFEKAFPGMKVNFTGAPTQTTIPRILRERESGVYAWDVLVGGAPSSFSTLKPAGAFAPLRPALLLPEITDDKLWLGGFDEGWLDKEKTYSLAFDFTAEHIIFVNWDAVSKDRLKSTLDLVKPEFANKIAWTDPRTTGEGIFASQVLELNHGAQFLTDLLSNQKIVYTLVRRQATEWLVRGQYPIGLAISPDDLAIFKEQGLARNVEPFSGGLTKSIGGAGFGNVQLIDRAPHPNAAKLYVNWLLTKQAQTNYARLSKRNSRRLDVPPGNPAAVTAQNATGTINAQSEEQISVRAMVQQIAKDKISAVAR